MILDRKPLPTLKLEPYDLPSEQGAEFFCLAGGRLHLNANSSSLSAWFVLQRSERVAFAATLREMAEKLDPVKVEVAP